MSTSRASDPTSRSFADGVSLPLLLPFLREGVYLMSAEGQLLDANPVARELLGLPAPTSGLTEQAHQHVRDASRPPAMWRAELDALAADGSVREFTREFVHADGSRRTVLDTCLAHRDDGTTTFLGVLVDITAEPPRTVGVPDDVHARDAATGAFTPDYLTHLAADATSHAEQPLGVCVVQVDPPAHLEHASAHEIAHALDARLERLTRFLLRHIRVSEAIVRTGAHELVLVMPRTDELNTETVARRLQLAALRSAPCPFRLGWCARSGDEALAHALERARHGLIPVRVVEREFQPARHD